MLKTRGHVHLDNASTWTMDTECLVANGCQLHPILSDCTALTVYEESLIRGRLVGEGPCRAGSDRLRLKAVDGEVLEDNRAQAVHGPRQVVARAAQIGVADPAMVMHPK